MEWLTDEWHPTQMLADYLTVQENFGRLEGLTLVYCGDGRNNVANSLLVTGAILGVNVHIFSPKELFPEKEIVELAEGFAKESGARILITEDADEAVKGADVLYTDVWVSMGEEDKFAERVALLKPYQVNMDLVKKADNENLIFLHCLPAFHDTNTVYGKDVAEKFGVEEMEVQTKSSAVNMLVISTKQKTVCTQSKRLWLQLLETSTFQSIILHKKPSTNSYEGCD